MFGSCRGFPGAVEVRKGNPEGIRVPLTDFCESRAGQAAELAVGTSMPCAVTTSALPSASR